MQKVIARRGTWALIAVQAVVAAAYFYGVVAFITTDAAYFPEQSPPGWAWPAVLSTALGPLVGLLCALTSLPMLAESRYRARNPRWRLLAVTSAANLAMLVVMLTPWGWEIFDWYVS